LYELAVSDINPYMGYIFKLFTGAEKEEVPAFNSSTLPTPVL